MPVKLESFDGGLFTAPDPVLMREGTLIRAGNARYRPGDPAIWQAEGRSLVGAGGHGAATDVFFAKGLTWDPLTTVDGNVPEQHQILYAREPASGTLYTIPARQGLHTLQGLASGVYTGVSPVPGFS